MDILLMDGEAIRIGEVCLTEGLITSHHLQEVLEKQQRQCMRLGDILLHEGNITYLDLHRMLARQQNLPFANLVSSPPDKSLLQEEDCYDYIRLSVIPWRREGEKILLATSDATPQLHDWARERFERYGFALTSPLDINWTVEACYAKRLDHDSRLKLWKRSPHQSARITLDRSQKYSFITLSVLLVVAGTIYPQATIIVLLALLNVFYLGTVVFKLILYITGARQPRNIPPIEAAARVPERHLPIYTLLVPLYKEAEGLGNLLDALRGLDYPKSKLDVKLIVEADDYPTIEAAKKLRPEGMFEIIRVPYSLPRTKPKACNYALRFARGEYVTIYDAEDRPDSLQLRQAVERFRTLPPDVACLQARLNYYNREDNLLTRLFSIEYATWFDYMLYGLQRLCIPIPLGGTSNHMALRHIRALGEWDPYNVTEDADLGMRLALAGYKTAMLDSLTQEEAPIGLLCWLRQRSRWIKGYMQTWLVHMRDPIKLYTALKPRAFWGFQFFIGGPCAAFLATPFLLLAAILTFTGDAPGHTMPGWLLMLSLANLLVGVGIHLFMAAKTVKRAKWKHMAGAVLLFPFYWVLHSVASFKALWQLAVRPHFWEKTPHGLSKTAR